MSDIQKETFSRLASNLGDLLTIIVQVDQLLLKLSDREDIFENHKDIFEKHFVLSKMKKEVIEDLTKNIIKLRAEISDENIDTSDVVRH